jgi:hypothetical protein
VRSSRALAASSWALAASFTHRGLGCLGLCCLLLDRRISDAKLGRLGALLGEPLVSLLDQSTLTGERRPHATLVTNEERLVAGTLLELLTTVKPKNQNQRKE